MERRLLPIKQKGWFFCIWITEKYAHMGGFDDDCDRDHEKKPTTAARQFKEFLETYGTDSLDIFFRAAPTTGVAITGPFTFADDTATTLTPHPTIIDLGQLVEITVV